MEKDSQLHVNHNGAPIFVLGNGPSLRDFDFGRLKGRDTLGMNAAYRYWDTIDWRPTYYCCLDDALIDTHKDAILNLIQEGRIKEFFLSGRILQHFPKLATTKSVHFLDSFVAHWHGVRGKAFGLPALTNEAFLTEYPDLLTTGAYSVRFAAALGYRSIYLLGIDLTYTSIGSVAEMGGNRLRLTETLESNPNYFFDDYQRAGDEFHIPNPDSHNEELHVAAFAAVRDDFVTQSLPISVYNTNPISRLSTESILPFRDLSSVLDEPKISALAIPLTTGEHEQLLTNLWLWSQPAFAPYLGVRPINPPDLILICNNSDAALIEKKARHFIQSHPHLETCFGELSVINLNLSGASDVYQRENAGTPSPEGWRAGPNNLFFGAMEAIRDRPGYCLYLETDCVPLRPDWLRSLESLVTENEPPWVIGSFYRGNDALGPGEKRHINGNALYATGNSDFQRFVDDVWKPELNRMIETQPELPFDCAIEALFQRADGRRQPIDPLWTRLQSVAHQFRYTSAIQNMAGDSRVGDALASHLADELRTSPTLQFIHSRPLADEIHKLKRDERRVSLVRLLNLLASGLDLSAQPNRQVDHRNQNTSPRQLLRRVVNKISKK